MTALLAGATGLIGREVARQWAGPGPIHLLVRRMPPGEPAPPALQRLLVVDYSALPALPQAEVALCCLGTTIKVAGSQQAFRAVDHTAVLAFARAAQRAGVKRLAVVSSLGASPASASFYSRVKGEMEAELQTLGLERLVIARPSLLAGNRAALGQPPRPGERLALALTAPLARFMPKAWRPIQAAVGWHARCCLRWRKRAPHCRCWNRHNCRTWAHEHRHRHTTQRGQEATGARPGLSSAGQGLGAVSRS